MLAYKIKLQVPADHRVSFELPADFPVGEAEVIVLAPDLAVAQHQGLEEDAGAEFSRWLGELLDRLPAAPVLPDQTFDRASIYEELLQERGHAHQGAVKSFRGARPSPSLEEFREVRREMWALPEDESE